MVAFAASGVFVVGGLGVATVAAPATASTEKTVEFTSVGATTWTVPESVISVTEVARGGGGGGGTTPTSKGGDGALVTAEFPVSNGEVLSLFVGGGGAVEGGGGGATSVFVTQSRFVVAGGGGGGGYGVYGSIDDVGASGGPSGFNRDLSGVNGASLDLVEGGFGGSGGTGGDGGKKMGGEGNGGDGSSGGNGIAGPGGKGRNGAAGGAGADLGGAGGDGFDGPTERGNSSSGGGGGGGYGGGGGGAAFFSGAGGGAGGSGLTGATLISYERARNGGDGAAGGNGSIRITFTADSTPDDLGDIAEYVPPPPCWTAESGNNCPVGGALRFTAPKYAMVGVPVTMYAYASWRPDANSPAQPTNGTAVIRVDGEDYSGVEFKDGVAEWRFIPETEGMKEFTASGVLFSGLSGANAYIDTVPARTYVLEYDPAAYATALKKKAVEVGDTYVIADPNQARSYAEDRYAWSVSSKSDDVCAVYETKKGAVKARFTDSGKCTVIWLDKESEESGKYTFIAKK